MRRPLSRFCTCDVCGVEEFAQRALLPAGWMTLWDIEYTLCGGCVAAWKTKFGEEPTYFVMGGEEELKLL